MSGFDPGTAPRLANTPPMPMILFASALFFGLATACAAQSTPAGPTSPSPLPATVLQYVIPAGQEQLLADMLGRGQALPNGCTLTDGQIDRSTIVATYNCDAGQVLLDVSHPDTAPAGAVRTERFAVAVRSGRNASGLVTAIGDRIRAREGAFEWKAIGAPAAEDRGGRGTVRIAVAGLFVAAVLLVAALAVWLARRAGTARRARGAGSDGTAAP